MKSLLLSLLVFLLRAYKLAISPYLGQRCRFYPECSAYAELALRRHGVIKGAVLAGKRLCKCHPWHAGGVDLVPEIKSDKTSLKLARFNGGACCDSISTPSQHNHHHN